MMALGQKGTALIKSFEGFRDKAYQDQRGIWTCGFGHTGPDVVEGTTCTPYQASKWFDEDTRAASNAVTHLVDVPLNQCQFDALCSFTYNIGIGNFEHSTLLKVLNAGNYMMAAEQFLVWDKTNHQTNPGLLRRRDAERALFLTT